MKISKETHKVKQTGIKGWIENIILGPYRFVLLAGLIVIALAAGFLSAWKFHPRTSELSAAMPTETATETAVPQPPTAVSNVQEEIAALPMLELSFDSQVDKNSLSATLWVNGKNKQTITANENQIDGYFKSGWLLRLAEENPDLLIEGKKFQLIHANADEAVSIWQYGKEMREAGINVPDFTPVLVSIDGAHESVYYLISESKFNNGIVFQLSKDFFTIEPYDILNQEVILNDVSQSVQQMQKEISEDALDELLSYLTTLMKQSDEKINGFSIDRFSEFYAIHDLWAASYEDLSSTPTYFYNLNSKRIEPVISDVNEIVLTGEEGTKSFPFSGHPLVGYEEMQMAYVSALAQRSALENFESMQKTEYAEFHAFEKKIKEFTGTEYSSIWNLLSFRRQMMDLQVNPPYPVRGFVYAESATDCVNVRILNLMVLPVDLDSIAFLGVDIPLRLDWLQNPTDAAILEASDELLRMKPYQNPDTLMNFCVPTAIFEEILVDQEIEEPMQEMLLEENTWMINAHISGLENEYTVAMIPDIPPISGNKRDMPPVQTVQQLTETFPFITSNEDGNEIVFTAGAWQVESDIVIPSGLMVSFEPGCQLHFASDVVLLSFSALQAIGTEYSPVVFSSIGETWPGLIVIDAQDQSLLEHVIIEKTGGIERGGWILTGGITFYRSPVTLRYATLQDSVVEDAINVLHTTFTFDHLTIQRTPSDAFDSDFANGEIIECHFEDIGGDAIDISGAYVDVSNTTMVNVVDKGLSAGEDSHMTADHLSMINMGIGGAAKDLSTLVINNSTIENAKVAGLAAYIKKSVFGPSSIEAENVQIVDTATETLVQTGSSVIWNGKKQDTKDLNVKTLYELGILGN